MKISGFILSRKNIRFLFVLWMLFNTLLVANYMSPLNSCLSLESCSKCELVGRQIQCYEPLLAKEKNDLLNNYARNDYEKEGHENITREISHSLYKRPFTKLMPVNLFFILIITLFTHLNKISFSIKGDSSLVGNVLTSIINLVVSYSLFSISLLMVNQIDKGFLFLSSLNFKYLNFIEGIRSVPKLDMIAIIMTILMLVIYLHCLYAIAEASIITIPVVLFCLVISYYYFDFGKSPFNIFLFYKPLANKLVRLEELVLSFIHTSFLLFCYKKRNN